MSENNVAVVGATGFSGREVVRWLRNHPAARTVRLTGSPKSLVELKQFATHLPDTAFVPFRHGENALSELLDRVSERGVEAVFLATEADTSLELARDPLDRNLTVIDLSPAFRLKDAGLYPK